MVLFGAWTTSADALQSPLRIDTAVALKQVSRRVEPGWSGALIDANPGAVLAADVVVSPTGTVESVTVIVGPEALRPALVAALNQWTFTPFISGGRPVRAVVMVDFQLRNPQQEREFKSSEDYRAAFAECERSLTAGNDGAMAACEAAAEASESLHPDRRAERSQAIGMFGAALLIRNRPADAIVQLERALTFRRPDGADSESASLLVMIARANATLGDLAKADAAMTRAVDTLRRAISSDPPLKTVYSQMLEEFLREQAAFKSALGAPDDARSLRDAAARVGAPARGAPMPPVSKIGGLQLAGAVGPQLDPDDLRQIRALLPKGKEPWLLIANGDNARWYAFVFLAPDAVTNAFRRGEAVTLFAVLGAGNAPSRRWEAPGIVDTFIQVPLPGREPGEIRRSSDLAIPVRVPRTEAEPLSDIDVASLINFLRAEGARSGDVGNPGDPRSRVRPWPVEEVIRRLDGTILATLHEGAAVDSPRQRVAVRREGAKWVIDRIDRQP